MTTAAADQMSRALEQAEAGAEAMAKTLAIFFNSLIQSGLERSEAFALTQNFLVSMTRMVTGANNENQG